MDRNVLAVYAHPILYRRSLRGNVDRNIALIYSNVISIIVVPYVGTWIEIDRTSLWTVPLIIFVVCYKGDKLKNSEGHYRSFLLSDKKQ